MTGVGKRYRRAAVFGAGGAIGGALASALAADGLTVHAGSRAGAAIAAGALPFRFDLDDEGSIAAAAAAWQDAPPDVVIIATGALTLPGGRAPERSIRQIDAADMAAAFRINTIGPALILKHVVPLLPRRAPCGIFALSARVGSIGDNRLGGWHSYRASKAALNMLVRNTAIELARTHPESVVAALHPGTVDSALSQPFQRGLPEGQLTTPDEAAGHLLRVIGSLSPADSGNAYDWRGEQIAP